MSDKNEILANKLKENTEILIETFSDKGLKVLQIAYQPNNSDDDCTLYIELSSEQKIELEYGLEFYVNFYDSEGNLFLNNCSFLNDDFFSGYHTISIGCYYKDKSLKKAAKAKIWVK